MAGESLIGNLAVLLSMDTAAFEDGNSYAQKTLKKTQRQFEQLGTKIGNIGKTLSLGVTLPLVAFGTHAAKAAIDAEEMQSAFNVSFGAMADDARRWAEETGDALGRATTEMQQGALTMHAIFKAGGQATDQTRKLAQQMAVLAQDLASFYNSSPEEALNALRSGLIGESEPLRRYSILLNEAAVNSAALELGLKGVNNPLTEQEKLFARAHAITKMAGDAQGDLARTSGSTANRIRAAQSAWQELSVTVGQNLVPALTPLIGVVADLIGKFSQLSPETQKWIVIAAAAGAVFGPLLTGIGALLSVAGRLLPLILKLGPAFKLLQAGFLIARTAALAALPALTPFLVPLGAIALAVGAVYLAWKHWDKIAPILSAVATAVKTWIGDKVLAVINFVKAGIQAHVIAWQTIGRAVVTAVTALYTGVKTWLQDKLGAVLVWVSEKVRAVAAVFKWLYDVTVGHSYVPDMVNRIGDEMGRLDSVMVQPATAAADQVAAAFRNMSDEVRGVMDRLFPEEAAWRQFLSDDKVLGGVKDPALREEARRRLRREGLSGGDGGPPLEGAEEAFNEQLGEMHDRWSDELERWSESTEKDMVTPAKRGTQAVIESYARMAETVVRSIESIVGAFKNGGTFDKIMAVLGAVEQVAQMVWGGGRMATAGGGGFNFGGFRAAGGPVVPGRTYMVGEGGPEFFTPRRSGYVSPGRQNGPAARVLIVPTPYFDAHVEGRARTVAAPMIGAAAPPIVAHTQRTIARSQRRRIP